MADVIELVPNVVKLDADGKYTMLPSQAIDVSAHDRLDLQVNVITGTLATLKIETAMSNESDSDFVTAYSATNVTGGLSGFSVPSSGNFLFRYVRVYALASSGGAAVFNLRGMARSG